MGVGRNLSYKKSFFLKSQRFKNHINILSGDDDLFVNENATKQNTKIVFSEKSTTISDPPKNLEQLFIQKKRHYSTPNKYSFTTKTLLSLQYLSNFLFYAIFIYLAFVEHINNKIISIFLIRQIVYILTLSSIALKLKENDLPLYLFILEPFLLIFQFILGISNLFSKSIKWN